MNKLANIYKPIGTTPLQIIDSLRKYQPDYKDEKIGYAGRLDPLAHGVLLLMIGDATKERDSYLNLSKEYQFEVLFGVKTDTYDMLGLLKKTSSNPIIVNENVNKFVNEHIGTFTQNYPSYSSKTVKGKPLFWWARNNKLGEITIPNRKITIKSFKLLERNMLQKERLEERIHKTIEKVSGDFRQKEILDRWHEFFSETKNEQFEIATFQLSCSSGTYVRGVVNELGDYLGCGSIALDIKRMRVGEYTLEDALIIPNK